LECLCSHLGNSLTVEIDGVVFKGEYLLVCIANGTCYGGGFYSAPLARMDDGLLDVVLIKKVSRLKIASIIARYKAGTHFQGGRIDPKLTPWITFCRAKSVVIRSKEDFIANIDGECGPRRNFAAQIMPKAACLVVPERLAVDYLSPKEERPALAGLD